MKKIFKRLEELGVDPAVISAMQIVSSVPGDIVMCMNVTRIINNFNSDSETEDEVSDLLSELCSLHFNKK